MHLRVASSIPTLDPEEPQLQVRESVFLITILAQADGSRNKNSGIPKNIKHFTCICCHECNHYRKHVWIDFEELV